MGLRYEEVTEEATRLLDEVETKYFPELRNAKIIMLFDLKKRSSGGRVVLGRIMRTNDLLRHLTKDEAEAIEGYDYIITLDKQAWDAIQREDRIRLLRHELRHAYFDIESEANPYRLIDHSITDFYEEVELNKDESQVAREGCHGGCRYLRTAERGAEAGKEQETEKEGLRGQGE